MGKFIDLKCPRCGEIQERAWHSRQVCCSCRIEQEACVARSTQGLAWRAVTKAIRSGTIAPAACEVCGSSKTEAHHDDYADPLNVRWLCKSHHKQHHVKFGPGKNAYAPQPSTATR